ncbi:MAG: molybdopterin oxidoreductase [Pirellulaceae bacterium]|nr:MAG: molybdopterin oxidoreductase [Pirellulaceae bacterium]
MTATVERRQFLKSAAFFGGTSAFAAASALAGWQANAGTLGVDSHYTYAHNEPENIIYSVCLQCHTSCPIKCKLYRVDDNTAVLTKIDGNPYCPQTLFPNVPYRTRPMDKVYIEELYHRELPVSYIEGRICPKGQAGIQTLYDPYRLRVVLKRDGPRGSRRWKSISFDQAIQEIVEGGDLFGEGRVPGLRELFAVRDAELAARLARDARAVAAKQMTLDEFHSKYAEHLDKLIDPDHPDLGPKNNRFVFLAGRIQHGRKELMKRFTHDAFGSVNAFEHTTICEQSHHIAFEQCTQSFSDGKWGNGRTHMKPDIENAEFIIFFGTGAFEANFGPPLMGGLVATASVENRLKYVVVDPRCSKTAGKAWKWVPIKPGGDIGLAMGMIRWIIENQRYHAAYLRNANQAAAQAAGEPSFTTATYLVKLEDGGKRPGAYLRASEVTVDGQPLGNKDQFVVSVGGKLTPVQMDGPDPVIGDLEVDTTTGSIPVKSAFTLLKERAFQRTLEQYAQIAGLDQELGGAATIEQLAYEFTSHGRRAVAEFYRGPVQHTNGYYQAQAIILLNLLVGNPGWKGGLSVGGGHFHEFGGSEANPYHLEKMHPGKLTAFGVPITREKVRFEDTTLFHGHYDAKRPWYPFSSNVYQEVIPSAADAYPYSIGCLFLHKGTPVMSCPAGHKLIDILRDTKKIPLLIACDIVIGETSMYADYIIPDLAIWERWGTPHTTPAMLTTASKIRQPVVAPITQTVTIDGEEMPISMEAFLIAVAKRLGLSGFGKDAFGPGLHFDRPEDFYLKAVVNIAMGDKLDEAGNPTQAAPEADDEELELFRRARRHLPPSVFDEQKWQRATGDPQKYWRRVVSVLNRGGNFEDWDKRYRGDRQAHPYAGNFNLYVEPVAMARHSMTGEYFDGLPVIGPVCDAKGNAVEDVGYPLQLITFKDILGGQSRTMAANVWLSEQVGHADGNHVLINRRDARRLGLRHGQWVRIVSATNPQGKFRVNDSQLRDIVGRLEVIEGIRPGVVAVSWHCGHWAYGSDDVVVDGQTVRGDPTRSRGILPNPVLREDTSIGNVCLSDPIGGSASFYDTYVRVEPA